MNHPLTRPAAIIGAIGVIVMTLSVLAYHVAVQVTPIFASDYVRFALTLSSIISAGLGAAGLTLIQRIGYLRVPTSWWALALIALVGGTFTYFVVATSDWRDWIIS